MRKRVEISGNYLEDTGIMPFSACPSADILFLSSFCLFIQNNFLNLQRESIDFK
jgi:hypothetical protein